ncbi:MAG: hypothetical protein FPO08_04475 [Geobacter sp.]|nr:MAG: hypothetical protein FPO08_04475 [Geobacter sp.]
MRQEIKNGSGNIQIVGDGNRITQELADHRPDPENPNLITCPSCGKYGIYRLADQCPYCRYSFEKERLWVQQQERYKREQTLQVVTVMAVGVITAAILLSNKFHLSWFKSLGFGVLVILMLYVGILFLRVGLSLFIKKWQGRI